MNNLDEKFDYMLTVGLLEIKEESSSIDVDTIMSQGEPSGSSCEVLSIFGDVSGDSMLLYEKPTETDEGVVSTETRRL